MGKAMFLTGAAVGYVLGARAGRERYEQICQATGALRSNPKVQQATEMASARTSEMAHKVADTATEKAHSFAGAASEKASSVAGTVAEKAPSWMPGSRDSEGTDSGGANSGSTMGNTGMPMTSGSMSNGTSM